MKRAIYPGTFDPITNGHLDIIKRAATYLCDELILSIATNEAKRPLFSIGTRVEICEKVIASLPLELSQKIKIIPFDGLLIGHAKELGANLIVRGLRAVSDFEYEFQMAGMNARITHDIETVFLMAGERHQFISSRFVKEIHHLGGDISSCVPAYVLEYLNQSNLKKNPI